MPYRLYRTPIPEQSLQRRTGTTQAQVARLTQLQGSGQVKHLGTQPGDLMLDLQYRGQYATRLQLELKELIDSPTIEAMPLSLTAGSSTVDGYYAAESVDDSPPSPQIDDVASVTGTLLREGSLKSQFLAVETRPATVDHPFGNNTTPLVGIPAAAAQVEAVDARTSPSQRTTPSVVETVSTRLGDVDRYDPTAVSFDNPIFLYRLPYDPQGDVDPSLWDTYGDASIRDTDGTVQWGRVYDRGHDFRGAAVLENSRLKLTVGDPDDADATGRFVAERWNTGTDAWETVSLPDEDWAPLDLDVIRIGQARIEAQLLFEATAATTDASAGDTYAVDLELGRGGENALVSIPSGDTQGPLPTDLQSLLDPIAGDRSISPQPTQSLASNDEVRY